MFSVGKSRFEEGIPFGGENVHHTSINTWSVLGPKGHDTESIFHVVWREISKFVLVAFSNSNLVVTAASIQANKIEFASRVPEIIDRVFAARNGVLEG
jgi:hypothetical protein